jgi:hypothetical protein
VSGLFAIATECDAIFQTLRRHLVAAGVPEHTISPKALRDRNEVGLCLNRDHALLVLDARLPNISGEASDIRSTPALRLLEDIRSACIKTPALVITQGRNVAPDLDAFCTPHNRAIALPSDKLRTYREAIVKPFLDMVMLKSGKPVFRVIEVVFKGNLSVCRLGDHTGPLVEWDPTKQLNSVRINARRFTKSDMYRRQGWADDLRAVGEELFRTHVVEALGSGLFSHLERAAGGLQGLKFSFVIEDKSLYTAPFEASVRALEDDQHGPFVLLHAPVTRRLPPSVMIRTPRHRDTQIRQPVRVLFIRSQVGEHPDGPTDKDTLQILDAAGNPMRFSFSKLTEIDEELKEMTELARDQGAERMELKVIDLSKDCLPGGAGQLLERTLEASFDIIHYAGHAWSPDANVSGPALLVLPGGARGEASRLSIETFAGLAGKADARFVYLSACRGSSANTVQNLVMHGVEHAMGFRCDVEDDKAAKFATDFYRTLFAGNSISLAFRTACAKARGKLIAEDDSPIWITPILLAQAADWAVGKPRGGPYGRPPGARRRSTTLAAA